MKRIDVVENTILEALTDPEIKIDREYAEKLLKEYAEAKVGQKETIVNTRYYVLEQSHFDETRISIGFDSIDDAESFKKTMEDGTLYKDSNLIILKEC